MEDKDKKEKKRSSSSDRRKKLVWKYMRPVVIVLISLAIAVGIFVTAGAILVNKLIMPVDPNDATPIEFVIEDGWGASTIAKHLYEACGKDQPGLIRNKAVFKIYVDFMGKSKDLQAGKYYLSKNMDISDILNAFCAGGVTTQVVKVTIPEGSTVENVVDILINAGMYIDSKEFLELCKTGEKFTNYEFVNNVYIADEERFYALEGYLFPDTYEFYIDASSETVITRMLDRFKDVVYSGEESYKAMADKLGMSIDEVLSLAALIEKEAIVDEDFYKVSAVFHNRINENMKLESDAPLPYILGTENRLLFNEEEKYVDSPYNTHVYKGVPLGPICNPGRLAIEAAVSPNAEYLSEQYLFFCLMDKGTGALAYAKTNAEHERNVAKYSPNW